MPSTPRDDQLGVPSSAPTSRRRIWFVLAAVVVVCGAVIAALGAYFVYVNKVDNQAKTILSNLQSTPGIYVTLTAKRDSMKFHGASTAEAYVFPRGTVDGTLSFDGMVTFRNDVVTTTFTLLNDRVYLSTASATSGDVLEVTCLKPSQVPPIHLMAYSLTTSTVLDEVKGTDPTLCPSGKLLQLSFAGESFVFCNGLDNKLQRATSDDLDVVIQYVSDPTKLPDLAAPSGANGTAPLDCPIVVPTDVPVAPVPSYVETASMVLNAATGPTRSFTIKTSSCECRRSPQPCLFVHGIGVSTSGPIVDSFEKYWGTIHEYAPCCSSTKFVQFDTVSQGWTDPTLQKAFCNAALQTSRGAKQNTVGSLILVAHSMGNLIAGGAVASGMCQFSSEVTWMSLSAPMQGSQTTNLLSTKCAATNNWSDQGFAAVLGLAGLCPSPRAYVQLQHQTTVASDMQSKYLQAQAVRRARAAHVLCGTDSFGLVSAMSIPLAVVGAMSGHSDHVHDGVVDLTSCMAGISGDGVGDDSSNFHYMAAVNHLDTSFRYGDGWWGYDRKPQKWFECAL
ncbi:hypothetical protein H310_04560 [Aphanomyces invadans]|uniref:DUF676 domain-containing protein n=1 Tax=Aphanomyces invadans TaxID=157072 RepID=A0A024UEA1_9STRA|nr:hypothetical protein H310_04560 [Aphanomyces invadans]ETW04222.1 hypothetical protein H310_04560 [Aphanomyces invadans]|eukprot:XP_008867178.1 hypothetical protein H310_04560 [Aphanomyces invadans]